MNRRHVLFYVWFFLCAGAYGASALLGASLLTRAIVALIVAAIVGEVIVLLTLRRAWTRRRMTTGAKVFHFFVASVLDQIVVFISLVSCVRLALHGYSLKVGHAIIIAALVILWQIKETMVGAKYFADAPPPRG